MRINFESRGKVIHIFAAAINSGELSDQDESDLMAIIAKFRDPNMRWCKSCGDAVEYVETAFPGRMRWQHIDSKMAPCYSHTTWAEPEPLPVGIGATGFLKGD